MPGVTLDVLYKDDELRKRTRALQRSLSRENFGGLLDEIGETVKTQTMRRFENETAPDGSRWPQSLRAKLEGGQTLTDTGRLRDSITYAVAMDKGSVEVGTNVVYAAIHQEGGVITAKTSKGLRFRVGGSWSTKRQVEIPARPYIGLNAQDEADLDEVIQDWAKEQIKEAFAQ